MDSQTACLGHIAESGARIPQVSSVENKGQTPLLVWGAWVKEGGKGSKGMTPAGPGDVHFPHLQTWKEASS